MKLVSEGSGRAQVLVPFQAVERYAAQRARHARLDVLFVFCLAISLTATLASLLLVLQERYEWFALALLIGLACLGVAMYLRRQFLRPPQIELTVAEFNAMREVVRPDVLREVEGSVIFSAQFTGPMRSQ